jgi:hypothetical protein
MTKSDFEFGPVGPMYHTLTKVLNDKNRIALHLVLAHLGPYQTLMRVWYSDPSGEKILFQRPPSYKFKKSPQNGFCMVTPHSE